MISCTQTLTIPVGIKCIILWEQQIGRTGFSCRSEVATDRREVTIDESARQGIRN
jgi:hypothetical protein